MSGIAAMVQMRLDALYERLRRAEFSEAQWRECATDPYSHPFDCIAGMISENP